MIPYLGSKTSIKASLGVITVHTSQLADLEIHNLVTSPLFAWACWLCLGSLMVRQLRGHLGIALLQQLLEIIEGLCVLQVQPEASEAKLHMRPHSMKIILTDVTCAGSLNIRDPDALQAESWQAEHHAGHGKGACLEERAALPAE